MFKDHQDRSLAPVEQQPVSQSDRLTAFGAPTLRQALEDIAALPAAGLLVTPSVSVDDDDPAETATARKHGGHEGGIHEAAEMPHVAPV